MTCQACHGSGKCWVCGGDGLIDYMPPGGRWCAACQGSGICYMCSGEGWLPCTCDGTGIRVNWMYNFAGAAVILSLIGMVLFLGAFLLSLITSAFYLSYNDWVYKVTDMSFWFNPIFMVWLFAKHRTRWAKWTTATSLILSILWGFMLFGIISLKQIEQEAFVTGASISIPVTILFSIFFHKSYVSELDVS